MSTVGEKVFPSCILFARLASLYQSALLPASIPPTSNIGFGEFKQAKTPETTIVGSFTSGQEQFGLATSSVASQLAI